MGDGCVAEMKTAWVANALKLLSVNVAAVAEADVEANMKGMLLEVNNDYAEAMRRAALDYVLLNEEERKRLGVALPPLPWWAEWGQGVAPTPPPPPWRSAIQLSFTSLDFSLHLTNPCMRRLQSVWQRYQHHSLVCMPDLHTDLTHFLQQNLVIERNDDERYYDYGMGARGDAVDTEEDDAAAAAAAKKEAVAARRLTISDFEAIQKAKVLAVRDVFVKEWMGEVDAILRAYIVDKGLTFEGCRSFFNSVATLMSNQLRTIVQRSVTDFHAFFARFAKAPGVKFAEPDAADDGDSGGGGGGSKGNNTADDRGRSILTILPSERAPFHSRYVASMELDAALKAAATEGDDDAAGAARATAVKRAKEEAAAEEVYTWCPQPVFTQTLSFFQKASKIKQPRMDLFNKPDVVHVTPKDSKHARSLR
jgi:hypothetical protein